MLEGATATVSLTVNGEVIQIPVGSTVSAAVLSAGITSFRRSVTAEPRGPLCGMGICFECRVTIDGVAQVRSCQICCEEGMEIVTETSTQ